MDSRMESEMDLMFREVEGIEVSSFDGSAFGEDIDDLMDDMCTLPLSDPDAAVAVSASTVHGKGKSAAGRGTSKDPYEKKKEYNRMRNKKLREAERQEVITLRNQASELERLIHELARRRRGTGHLLGNGGKSDGNTFGMLPWKEVATIFKSMATSSESQRDLLSRKVDTYYNVAAVMHQWVHSSHHLPVMPEAFKQTWRNSTLVAHESSRLLGFDWIAKQLYHNIDTMIQHCGLPASLDECSDVKIYPLENQNSYHLSKARQRIEDATLEEVMQVLQRQYFEGKSDTLDNPDPNVRYFRNSSSYGTTSQNAYNQNILMRQFVEENRYVVFAHSITEDEKYPVDRIQRNWTNWTVAERIGTSTIIKQMAVASGLRMNETFLPFDLDPATATPLDMEAAFLEFKHKTEVYHKYVFANEIATFRRILAQVRAENLAVVTASDDLFV